MLFLSPPPPRIGGVGVDGGDDRKKEEDVFRRRPTGPNDDDDDNTVLLQVLEEEVECGDEFDFDEAGIVRRWNEADVVVSVANKEGWCSCCGAEATTGVEG